jgi:heat shock protein HslJ
MTRPRAHVALASVAMPSDPPGARPHSAPRPTRSSAAWLAAVGALCFVAAACSGGSSDNSSTTTTSAGVALVGTNWELTDAASLGVPLGAVTVTARFDSGTVSGDSGCNSYSATYRTSGDKLTISSSIAATQRACEPAPTAVEQHYLARLPKTASYAIRGDQLTLSDAGGNALLVYRAVNGAQAIERSWTVTSYYTGNAVQSVAVGSTLTATFDDGRITGDAGCNTFNGPYVVTLTKIRIGPLASTRRACPSEEVATQETHYLAALELATTFRVTGARLELFRADGGLAATFDAL